MQAGPATATLQGSNGEDILLAAFKHTKFGV
jgi:hypothetical protein